MPLERVSQGFRDISASFKINPLNDDLVPLKNEQAIARSIRNIVFTIPGEKPFQPDFGSNISSLLFESIDEVTAVNIKDEIRESIEIYEPRVILRDVAVFPDYDNNNFEATIIYEIVGIDAPPQSLEFVLQPTR
tara:strand:- start:1044 stop:1445 length:402 start_codon:yes stop_codon:yes gene_type:complete